MSQELIKAMAQSIVDGEPEIAADLAGRAIEAGIAPLTAINAGFMPGLQQVGEAFNCGDLFLPELVAAGEAMKAAVAILEPEMTRTGVQREILGKVVLGTIEGDIHDIGKTLVGTLLASSGFQVYDLGVDVPVAEFVEKARQVGADLVGVSALLTTTMARQRDVIIALEAAGLRPGVKVIVGGAPVTRSWATEIGADGFSEDAIGAVALARELIGSPAHSSGRGGE